MPVALIGSRENAGDETRTLGANHGRKLFV